MSPVASGALIVVVYNDAADAALRLKELVEFMDAPTVVLAAVDSWLAVVGERRLGAVFINDDVHREQRHQVFTDVRERDPNTPIVIIRGGDGHA